MVRGDERAGRCTPVTALKRRLAAAAFVFLERLETSEPAGESLGLDQMCYPSPCPSKAWGRVACNSMAETERDETYDDLDAQLRAAVKDSLTPEEFKAQRLSFVVGMVGRKSGMTRSAIEEFIDAQPV